MFCKRCYVDLRAVTKSTCPACKRAFDPTNPKTYLRRPFPPALRIAAHVIATTLVALGCAYVVAFFQMARTSGH
jgi:hypothetical protein